MFFELGFEARDLAEAKKRALEIIREKNPDLPNAEETGLLRIAANTAKNALRSRDRRTMVDVEDVQLGSVHAEFGRLEKAQTGEILRIAIQKLPPKQRQALELRIFEDLPFKEIAEIMDAPFDTAKANFRHAVTNLKKILEATDQGRALDDLKSAFESLTEDEGHEPLG